MTKTEIWNTIRPLLEAGKTNDEIASELNLKGQTTPEGKRFHGTHISKFAIENGVRRKRPYKHSGAKALVTAKEPSLADDVLDVMTSSLREPLKMRLVNLLTEKPF